MKITFSCDLKTWGFLLCFRSSGGGLFELNKIVFYAIILCFAIIVTKKSKESKIRTAKTGVKYICSDEVDELINDYTADL